MSPGPPVLAIDLGGSSVRAEVLGPDGMVLGAGRRPVPPLDRSGPDRPAPAEHTERVIEAVARAAREALAGVEPATATPVAAVGLAVPGLIDADTGVALYSANLGWRDLPLASRVSALLGLPVRLCHDVRAAGLAELTLGAARGLSDVVIVVIGTGISAVLVSGGAVLRGTSGQAGELGHLVVTPDGPVCGCGRRGCLEAVASAGAIARHYAELTGRPVGGAADVVAGLPHDVAALEVWRSATEALGDALLGVSALLAPSVVVVGGGLSGAGDALLDPVRDRMRLRRTVEPLPRLCLAAFGARAGLVGAGLVARRALAEGVVA